MKAGSRPTSDEYDFKSNAGWWMDPLSLFDDDDDDDNDNDGTKKKRGVGRERSEPTPRHRRQDESSSSSDDFLDVVSEFESDDDQYYYTSNPRSQRFTDDVSKSRYDKEYEQKHHSNSPRKQSRGEYGMAQDELQVEALQRVTPSSKFEASSKSSEKNSLETRSSAQSDESSSQLMRSSSVFSSSKQFFSGNPVATTFLIYAACRAAVNWCNVIFCKNNKEKGKKKANEFKSRNMHPNFSKSRLKHVDGGDYEDDPNFADEDENLEKDDDLSKVDTKSEETAWLPGSFDRGMPSSSDKNNGKKVRMPPSRVLVGKLEELSRRCEEAEAVKEAMEKEYEKASWQLQETMSELKSLKTTTRHLQSQLVDNESNMERAIRAERRKAKEELLRMREAMVKVVEREREQMREEFMKQAAELQALWKKQQQQQVQQQQQPQKHNQRPTPPFPRQDGK